jgi:hypothetical protein
MVYKTIALPIKLRRFPPGWNRTNNPPVMSRVLYQLSYRIGQGGIEPTVLSTMVFKTIAFDLSATCIAPDRNRTHNLLCVRQSLYQLSYQILNSVGIEPTTPACKTDILPNKLQIHFKLFGFLIFYILFLDYYLYLNYFKFYFIIGYPPDPCLS